MKPSIGRIVHYVSYGTPGGESPPEHRAAIVTAVREDEAVSLCILNPMGLFFNERVLFHVDAVPGTWHWPEREG